MAKAFKIACMVIALASIWFTFGIRGNKAFLKIGTWESRPILLTDMSSEDSESGDDSTETAFG